MRSFIGSGLKNKFKQLFKIGVITNTIPDRSERPLTQATTRGNKAQNCAVMNPYGVHGVAPVGGQAYMFSINGDEGNIAVIADAPQYRPKDLSSGEFITGAWIFDNTIYFKEDGTIEISANESEINITTNGASQVNVNGCEFLPNGVARIPTLEVGTITSVGGGAITTDVDIEVNGISSENHTHGGVTTGAGNTGGPQ